MALSSLAQLKQGKVEVNVKINYLKLFSYYFENYWNIYLKWLFILKLIFYNNK